MEPKIEIIRDYDGAFECLVRSWIKRKIAKGTPFKHTTIRINSGPWRSEAVTANAFEGGILVLDFYAAIRNGFGSLPDEEVEQIIDNWL